MEDDLYSYHHQHRPIHMQLPDAFYFLTARTIKGVRVFQGEQRMKILHDVLIHAQELYKVKIFGYILWPDHYHIILQLAENVLHRLVNNIHTFSARLVNELDKQVGRRVWYQYWDRFLRIEHTADDFYRRVAYIIYNPVKHGWCKTFDQALDYKWSSLPLWKEKYGRDVLLDYFMKYKGKDWQVPR